MKRRARWLVAAALCAAAFACRRESGGHTVRKQLKEGALAEVGGDSIATQTVERIAAAQLVSPAQALEHAVADALFAREARSAVAPSTQSVVARAANARSLLETFASDARAAGPPGDNELNEIVAERWNELDRPPSVQVTHAVALATSDSSKRAAARKMAEAIRQRVDGIHDPEVFIRTAKELASGGVEVVAERLPFIAVDGRGMGTDAQHPPAGEFDPEFAKAANALGELGSISGVVESSFGFHVILLEARLPPQKVPLEDLRRALTAEVLSRRAGRARNDLLQRLHQSTPIELARDAEQATQKLVR